MKKWAFLIHPRDRQDITNLNPVLNFFPQKILEQIVKKMGPRIVADVQDRGWLVGCFLFPQQFFELPLDFVSGKIVRAAQFAKELGAHIIGLGELTSPFMAGGKRLVKEMSGDVIITNGNSLTAGVVASDAREIAARTGCERIAIIGATGSIGSAVSQMLSKNFELFLVARNLNKLERVKKFCGGKENIIISTDIENTLKSAEIIILLTSSAEVVLRGEYLNDGMVIYDVTQPSNLDPEFVGNGVKIIKGGLVRRKGLSLGFDMQIPRETSFACLAETITLAELPEAKRCQLSQANLVGDVKPEIAEKIFCMAEEAGFTSNIRESFLLKRDEDELLTIKDYASITKS